MAVEVSMLPWLIFGGIILVLLLFNWGVTKYYLDPFESYKLGTLVVVSSLTVSLLCALLIPVDVFVISAGPQSIANIALSKASVKTAYYVLYAVLLVIGFVLVPFAYFYGEDQAEDDFDEVTEEKCNRFCTALKYTTAVIVFVAVLVFVGLVFRPGHNSVIEKGKEVEWIQEILDVDHAGDGALTFTIACLTFLGLTCWVTYTAYGLAALPLDMLKSPKPVDQERLHIDLDLANVRDKHRSIQEKYAAKKDSRDRGVSSRNTMSKRDLKELHRLKQEERTLSYMSNRLNDRIKHEETLLARCLLVFAPFKFLFGILGVTFSLLVSLSLILSIVDKILHSECGFRCGYVVESSIIFNPLDEMLVYLSRFFPMDFVALVVLVVYIFLATVYGVLRLGIRLGCVKLFRIQHKKTRPQALLLMSSLLLFALLVLSNQMLTLAPQYSIFGTQTYTNAQKQVVSCSVSGTKSGCSMSNIAIFMSKISLSIPFFSIVFFYANWIFLVVFLSCAVYLTLTRRSSIEVPDSDDEDLERAEERSLLGKY